MKCIVCKKKIVDIYPFANKYEDEVFAGIECKKKIEMGLIDVYEINPNEK